MLYAFRFFLLPAKLAVNLFRISVVFGLLFCFTVHSMTLGEISAGSAIANTIASTPEPSHQHQVQNAKDIAKKIQEKQHEQEIAKQKDKVHYDFDSKDVAPQDRQDSPNLDSRVDSQANSKPDDDSSLNNDHPQSGGKHLENLSESELDDRLYNKSDSGFNNDVDYKKGTAIFYTNYCSDESVDCNRRAVLTNIKSVVFDYNNRRGLYAEVPRPLNLMAKGEQGGSKPTGNQKREISSTKNK